MTFERKLSTVLENEVESQFEFYNFKLSPRQEIELDDLQILISRREEIFASYKEKIRNDIYLAGGMSTRVYNPKELSSEEALSANISQIECGLAYFRCQIFGDYFPLVRRILSAYKDYTVNYYLSFSAKKISEFIKQCPDMVFPIERNIDYLLANVEYKECLVIKYNNDLIYYKNKPRYLRFSDFGNYFEIFPSFYISLDKSDNVTLNNNKSLIHFIYQLMGKHEEKIRKKIPQLKPISKDTITRGFQIFDHFKSDLLKCRDVQEMVKVICLMLYLKEY